jgi:hypothetical protein
VFEANEREIRVRVGHAGIPYGTSDAAVQGDAGSKSLYCRYRPDKQIDELIVADPAKSPFASPALRSKDPA